VTRPARKIYYRNTPTERRCPECEGAGEITVNTTNPHGYGPDPQCDEQVPCPRADCNSGWITWAPVDALSIMAKRRNAYLRGKRLGVEVWDHIARRAYDQARNEACEPVDLPLDGPRLSAETCAHFNNLARLDPTAEVYSAIESIFGFRRRA